MKKAKPEIQSTLKTSVQKSESLPDMEAPAVKPITPVNEGEPIMKVLTTKMTVGLYIGLLVLGIATGYVLSRSNAASMGNGAAPATVNTGKVVGSTDTTTFKDSAVGVVQKGGTDGEGTHQLIRDGGPSQTVTLLSSVVDLDQYVGKKVKVFGQTLAAQKAAWLMDVGRVELQ